MMRFSRRLPAALAAGVLTLSLTACAGTLPADEAAETAQLFAMDTVMYFTAYGDQSTAAAYAAQAEVLRLEDLLSRTRPESAVSQLNTLGTAEVDREVWDLLAVSGAYAAATGGAFDITVAPLASAWGFTEDAYRVPAQSELDALLPLVGMDRVHGPVGESGTGSVSVSLDSGTQIDLGGIAKGYAADRVAAVFREHAVPRGLVRLGGNIWACGDRPDGAPWRVGIQDPLNEENYAGILALTDAFAVTSGGYQRHFEAGGRDYHHIIDPATGYPAESGLLSVTIVADGGVEETGRGTMCDALSTALFVMGEEAAADFWRNGVYDFDMVLVTDDSRVLYTAGLENRFEPEEGGSYAYSVLS